MTSAPRTTRSRLPTLVAICRPLGGMPKLLLWALTLAWILVGNSSICYGQWIEKEDLVGPLVDGEPFDLIYLNQDGENAILKVLPARDPVPNPIPSRGMLVFEYADESEDLLQVPYSSVASYRTFNELLIEEAIRWLAEDDYAKAFRNLLYVYDHGGKNDPQLVQSLRSCLFKDGTENFRVGQYELALSIFADIYRRDPNFKVPGINKDLIEIIRLCYDGIIQEQFDNAAYVRVQKTLTAIEERYGDEARPLVEKWSAAFEARADKLMQQAGQYAANGAGRQAHLASRQAEQMAPGRESVKQLQEELLKQFPLIVVGVSQNGGDADVRRIDHWGSRRVGRLTKRTIVEMDGLSDEGGKYRFLNGELYRADEIGLQYVFELDQEPTAFGTPISSAFQIASRLLDAADPDSPAFDISWARVIDTVAIDSESKVTITLRTPYVRPEALLNFTYNGDPISDQNGIYLATQTEAEITTFELNPLYPREPDSQHPVVIEQLFGSASAAVDQLINGSIDVVDRVPIADIKRLKKAPGIVVRPYLLPTVHMLVPKIRGELHDSLDFRAGLSHAIDRERILENVICDGEDISGCEVITGPFPVGTEENDLISYGYDLTVRSPIFNAKLGMVLIELACRPTKKRSSRLKPPPLVIAHPKSSTALQGAQAIARMWSEIGLAASTRELAADETVPADDEWDFLYLEATVEEPLADAATLFGQNGIATEISAPAEQTLRGLADSESWRSACSALRRLHRQVAVDLSVIPLWQIKEHYAYRNTVRRIGRGLIHLYQNVHRWQIDNYGTDEQDE